MKSAFLKLLLILTLCVIGVGIDRGWFTVANHGRDTMTKQDGVSLQVDPDKVAVDAHRVTQKTTELASKVTE